MSDVQKPSMVNKPSSNRDGYGTPRKIEAICNHIATSTKASNLSWLTNPLSGASCNAYIARDGTIYEMVPIGSSPWTNGVVQRPDMSNSLIAAWVRGGISPNTRCYTIEHEGEARDTLTPAQIISNNRVTAWVAAEAGLKINRTTIIGHYQIDNVDRPYCPSFSDTEWRQLIDGANALLHPAPPEAETRSFPEAPGMVIGGGFKGFFEELEQQGTVWRVLGFPESNEFKTIIGGRERIVQRFQKGILVWLPEADAPWHVQLALLNEVAEIEAQREAAA